MVPLSLDAEEQDNAIDNGHGHGHGNRGRHSGRDGLPDLSLPEAAVDVGISLGKDPLHDADGEPRPDSSHSMDRSKASSFVDGESVHGFTDLDAMEH